jgi:PleD family two-component response regulator
MASSQSIVESLSKPMPAPGDQDYFSLSLSTQVPTPKSEPTHKEKIDKVDPDPSTRQDSPLILLVDDNHINISLLVAFMKKLGLGYLTAHNGQEALASFIQNYSRIRIVLMGRS